MADTCRRTCAEGLPEMPCAEVARAETVPHIGHGAAMPDMRLFVESTEADAPLQLSPLQFALLGCARKREAEAANGIPCGKCGKRAIIHSCKL